MSTATFSRPSVRPVLNLRQAVRDALKRTRSMEAKQPRKPKATRGGERPGQRKGRAISRRAALRDIGGRILFSLREEYQALCELEARTPEQATRWETLSNVLAFIESRRVTTGRLALSGSLDGVIDPDDLPKRVAKSRKRGYAAKREIIPAEASAKYREGQFQPVPRTCECGKRLFMGNCPKCTGFTSLDAAKQREESIPSVPTRYRLSGVKIVTRTKRDKDGNILWAGTSLRRLYSPIYRGKYVGGAKGRKRRVKQCPVLIPAPKIADPVACPMVSDGSAYVLLTPVRNPDAKRVAPPALESYTFRTTAWGNGDMGHVATATPIDYDTTPFIGPVVSWQWPNYSPLQDEHAKRVARGKESADLIIRSNFRRKLQSERCPPLARAVAHAMANRQALRRRVRYVDPDTGKTVRKSDNGVRAIDYPAMTALGIATEYEKGNLPLVATRFALSGYGIEV